MVVEKTHRFPIKYQPQTLSNFFIGSQITQASTESLIRTLIEIDDINILFVGNNCSGKTILLNIIIREYYGLAECEPIPENNILHINNLKEQGISFFRSEMKTHSQSRSSIFGKKKMIVIDDIDLINEQSQQTFRNYIDKYKKNIHFISVCTNIQKVIESVQSRLHIIKIEQPTDTQLLVLYDIIVSQEKLVVSDEAKRFLIRYCKKSYRALLNQMEKIFILGRHIDISLCKMLCSEVNYNHFELYINYLHNKELHNAIQVLYNISSLGYSVVDIYDYLFAFIKETNLLNEKQKYSLIPLFCDYITIFHSVHEDPIELALFTNRVLLALEAIEININNPH
jgi:DNA polymerase III delta prime subunit